jgi:3-oxoacyl-[acyl-carrier-protein] synthase II
VAGRSAVGPITLFDASGFPVRIAAEVPDWRPPLEARWSYNWERTPRQTQFVMAAAFEAAQSAGLADRRPNPTRFGVYLGCGELFPRVPVCQPSPVGAAAVSWGGGVCVAEPAEDLEEYEEYFGPDETPDMACTYVGARFGAEGPHANVITACTSSTQAVGEAAEVIRRGDADVMLTGGTHSMIHPLGVGGFYQLGVLSNATDLADPAMRPFDRNRSGFVVGEGAAVIVLESLDHARARRADVWAELAGYARTHDAFRLTDSHPGARGYARCLELALEDARLHPSQVSYINAHGTGTPLNDRRETIGYKAVFGRDAYRIPVSSIKSMLGHCTTACGAVDLVASLMTLRRDWIPPTINYETPDPECDLDYVPNVARRMRCRHVLSGNLGLGGQNAAIVLSRFADGHGWRRP